MEIKNTLNNEQKKAVMHGDGPLLIVAGAGTGKTTVITQRVTHLILDKGINTDGVLALTFTEKASEEMIERVDHMMPMGYVDLWISTFHSFCQKILEQHALDIGIPNDFKLLNQTAQWLLIRQNLDKFELDYYKPLGNPTKFIHALITHFSRCKDETIYPEEYLEYAEKLRLDLDSKQGDELLEEESMRVTEIANAYHTYQQLLLDNNALDFGDLINYCLKLFKTRKNVLKKYQKQFQYILVDEFQDTNYAQYELVKLLAGDTANLTVVADDDQSIYKFRGASVSNILQFNKDYPKAEQIVLTENYRSCQDILDLSYNFIKLNDPNRLEAQKDSKLNKKLNAHLECKPVIEHLHFQSLEDEIKGIITKIADLKSKNNDSKWSDFAILVRANESATQFTNFLRKTNLPYQYVALKGLYTKPIILDILNYFKLLDNYHESSAVFRMLRSPIVSILDAEITKINHYASKKSISLFEALRQAASIPGVSKETVSEINKLLALVEKHTLLTRDKTVGEIMLAFLNDSNYLEILKLDDAIAKQQSELLNQLYKRIQDFEASIDDPSLQNFMLELELERESGEAGSLKIDPEQGPDVIKIMTVHSAKGLEFKYVFIPNLVDQKFPTNRRSEPILIPEELIKDIIPEGDMHVEEERRLFYVAMTRAKEQLYLTSAEDYGGVRKKKISRFLVELDEQNTGFSISDDYQEAKKKTEPTSISLGKKEFEFEIPKSFSYSQIAGFRSCPYQYKLGYIYKIPTHGKGTFSFGKTMHSTLQKFFEHAHEKSGSAQNDLFGDSKPKDPSKTIGELVSFDELMKIFEESWIDEWYESKEIKESYMKKAKKSLKEFYDSNKDKPLQVRALEKGFNFKIGNDINKPEELYTLKGVIDRVDILEDGTAELIDYKTGTPKQKLYPNDKIQLLLYQIACNQIPQIIDGAKISKLTFYYLDNNTQVSFLGSEKETEKVSQDVIQTIQEIKTSNFQATPEHHACKHCDFNPICEYRAQ